MIKSKVISPGVTFIASALVLLVGHTALTKDVDATTHGRVVDQLVGGWSLVSRVTTGADGRILTDTGLSATPSGILIYDRAGHVAAQLSRPERTIAMLADECREAQKVKGTDDTAQTILGYDAYFGTYTVNEKEGIVTHHLESALFPGDIGKSIARRFAISGDTLTIHFSTTLRDGTPVTRTLVWTRLK
jgi:Lipocalin-like domain